VTTSRASFEQRFVPYVRIGQFDGLAMTVHLYILSEMVHDLSVYTYDMTSVTCTLMRGRDVGGEKLPPAFWLPYELSSSSTCVAMVTRTVSRGSKFGLYTTSGELEYMTNIDTCQMFKRAWLRSNALSLDFAKRIIFLFRPLAKQMHCHFTYG
jgi:hypothetical protein